MKRPVAIGTATLGLALVGYGLALWSIPVALVVTGLLIFAASVLVEVRP